MKKRSLTLLMTIALGLASVPQVSAQSTDAPAAPVSGLPSAADPRLATANVSLEIGTYSGPLSSLLAAIARSAGYDVIFETNVDALSSAGTAATTPASGLGTAPASTAGAQASSKPVVYNFKNTPFNQVWPLLMDIYGLTYETTMLGTSPVLRVGVRPIQQIIRLPAALDASKVSDQLRRAFGSVVRTSLTQQVPNTAAGAPTGSTTSSVTSGEEVVLDSPTLKIVPEPSSNSIIVRGTNTEVLQVQALASQIITAQPTGLAPTAPDPTVQTIYTVKGTPDTLPGVLKAQYPALTVTPVGQRLILSGPKTQVDAATALLGTIDAEDTTQTTYTVKGSPANVVTLLTAQFPTLKVTPAGQSGLLVISGPQAQVSTALSLLGTVDVAAAAPTQSTQKIYSVVGQQADIVALLAAQYPDLKVTPVGQTKQLVLAGTQPQIDSALALLTSVDKSVPLVTGPVIVQKVFPLTNASADDLKTVLEGTLARDVTNTGLVGNATPIVQADGTTVIQPPTTTTTAGTTASSATGTGAAAGAATNTQATIIADKRSNTLIVRGTQTQVDQVAQLIPSLDVRVPQVNLQVRIQEINETASRSLGVDWKAGFGNFVVNVASKAVSAIFDPTQALVGFNLGATLNALENQGMTKRVYDGAVTMQSGQRSLGSSTDTQNASSGAAAHIQSGGRIELNIPSTGANVPPIQKQIDYGVTLDFFNPQVAPDGTITVRVAGKVAGQPDSLTNINLINYTNSEAQTTITFKAGETVLLSGLLGNDQSTTSAGVPFLSSLPVVGSLFGTQTTKSTRSQLLIVITGNVLQ
ncbi:secretin [Deinococcus sp. KNUC1210]|uniref:type II secretion system protein GspD n=1 Tax=Deinococcus sp. KNUC1210 TaxID=2917691 RepID=UPI001EEF8C80|nr:secretin N-terminal domain-containing protein [Deinococcus sp. KNUC1210]ULH16674.1 secretin [Deinococcus sp. KNUC1210]